MMYILDSNSIITIVKGEEGSDYIVTIIDNPENSCYIHAINLCEVFYEFRRELGESEAQDIIEDTLTAVLLRNDMDSELWQQAGRYKADLKRISLADCFCLALADRLNGTVLTSDHHEFDKVVIQGIVDVEFFRSVPLVNIFSMY